jgi:hypothetical protein
MLPIFNFGDCFDAMQARQTNKPRNFGGCRR